MEIIPTNKNTVKNEKHIFLIALEAESLKSWCQCGCVLVTAPFGATLLTPHCVWSDRRGWVGEILLGFFPKRTDAILGALSSGSHQRPHLLIPSPWEGRSHKWIWGEQTFSPWQPGTMVSTSCELFHGILTANLQWKENHFLLHIMKKVKLWEIINLPRVTEVTWKKLGFTPKSVLHEHYLCHFSVNLVN